MLPGLRFRKGIKLFPGVRLNISKSGVSTSIGKRGATVNLSPNGTTATVGAPGTGLSYRKQLSKGGKGYYGFLVIMLGFYVLYVVYNSQVKPPPQSAPIAQTAEQPPAEQPQVKHHKKHHKAE